MADAQRSPQELAAERTELAYKRTSMAREHTFAAWVRTGLGTMGAGFAVAKVAEDTSMRWVASFAGIALILAGLAIHVGALHVTRKWTEEHPLRGIPI